ncbi:helix-turn-helix domain-containing protein [Pseudoalteromonas spongiae]|uniref:Helix-turn-helix domain-containing protein n=1 Tax=Pseudoalteromonas spongiae TaxID=298657 RepID=A0ABU8EWE4_9GAMM
MPQTVLGVIYFIAFSHALMLAISLWRKTKLTNITTAKWLALVCLIISYKLFEAGALYLGLYPHLAHFMDLLPGEVLLIGPLVFIYISLVVGEEKPKTYQLILHFIPAMSLWCYNAPSVFQSLDAKVTMWQFVLSQTEARVIPLKFVLLFLAIKTHLSIYLFLSWQHIQKFETVCNALRADNSKAVLKQLTFLVVSLFLLELVWVGLFIGQQFFAIGTLALVSDIWLLFIAVIILAIGYIALQKTDLLMSKEEHALIQQNYSENKDDSSNIKYFHSALSEQQSNHVAKHLEQQIKAKQLYLNDKLTLTTLAHETDIKAHTLSQVINQSMQTNFYRLINGYRIQHAISLIDDPSVHWPLERIAFESGFANRVTFSKAFKEIMGQTASEYKKQRQQAG